MAANFPCFKPLPHWFWRATAYRALKKRNNTRSAGYFPGAACLFSAFDDPARKPSALPAGKFLPAAFSESVLSKAVSPQNDLSNEKYKAARKLGAFLFYILPVSSTAVKPDVGGPLFRAQNTMENVQTGRTPPFFCCFQFLPKLRRIFSFLPESIKKFPQSRFQVLKSILKRCILNLF